MSKQAVEKYQKIFFDGISVKERSWPSTPQTIKGIEKGAGNLEQNRTRLIVLPSDTPLLDYLRGGLKKRTFPAMSMDDLGYQWFYSNQDGGTQFLREVEGLSPEFVAARALSLLGEDITYNTGHVLNILMPEREKRICFEAMNMLKTDFKSNKILEVRLPWRIL